ncbi:MAG: hypothetical protein ALAOOOJD_02773 [bacterium]|nr:hypothetical protein [bacterium]
MAALVVPAENFLPKHCFDTSPGLPGAGNGRRDGDDRRVRKTPVLIYDF